MKMASYVIVLGLMFSVLAGEAQTPASVSVPSQFATAHTVFLSSAGAPALASNEKEASSMAYSSLYKALVADGHYEVKGAPADAELSFEVSIGDHVGPVAFGSSSDAPYVRLGVYDVKTRCLLWNIDETLNGAFRASTFQKNVDSTVAKIIVDLHSLAAGKQP